MELSYRKAPNIIAAGRHRASPAAFSLIRALMVVCFVFTISGCPKDPLRDKGPEAEKAKVLVTVNGEQITERDFNLRLLNSGLTPGKLLSLSEERAAIVKHELLRNLIDNRLLLQYAEDKNIRPTEQQVAAEIETIKKSYQNESWVENLRSYRLTEAEWIESIRRRQIVKLAVESITPDDIIVTQAEIDDYLAAKGPAEETGAEIIFRQIFCTEQQKADEALTRLNEGADFAAIATEFSKAPEAGNGGVVGPVPLEIMPDELKSRLSALKPGERSEVFKSEYGYHIVEPIEFKMPQAHDNEQRKELARTALLEQKKEEVFRRWITQRRRDAEIEIIEQLP